MDILDIILFMIIGIAIVSIIICKHFNLLFLHLHKVDEDSRNNGGMLVGDVLKAHGVNVIFTLVGGHISPILVGAEGVGIRVIDTRHEATAVFAADAVARLTGNIGVAVVTAGPGVTNTITALKNAQMAESPVMLIGGAAPTILKGHGALQDIDQMSIVKSLCKFCASVVTVRDIIPTLRKAIQIARSGTPGPVFVELPVDILYMYSRVKMQAFAKQNRSTIKGNLISWYIEKYIQNIFAGAWEEQDICPLPVKTPMPNCNQVNECADLVRAAKRPILVVGSQAMLPPVLPGDLQMAVIGLGIPTFLGGMARGLLGHSHHLQLYHAKSEALKKADLVILAGAVCDFRLSYGSCLPKGAAIISVNRNEKQANKNAGAFWRPTITVVGDVATFLVNLATVVSGYVCDNGWISRLREEDTVKSQAMLMKKEENTRGVLNPIKLLLALEDRLPDNSILVFDGGDFVATASYILRPRRPLSWLDPGAFGTLGVGGGFALGAKLARPDSQVWIVYGDGSCGYSIMEYDTFVRHKIPLISLVGNDAGWTQIEREQKHLLGSSVGCVLAYSHYDDVVKGLGARGMVLSPNTSSMNVVYSAADDFHKIGHSILINAYVGKTSFRDGSISL